MKTAKSARVTPVIPYATAKQHLRIDDDSERQYIIDLVEDATSYAEEETQASIGTRTIVATYYGCEPLLLTWGPVQTVATVVDSTGKNLTYAPAVHGNHHELLLTSAATYPVTVTYTAGHDPIPGALRRCILNHIAACFDTRAEIADGSPPAWLERTYSHYRRTSGVS